MENASVYPTYPGIDGFLPGSRGSFMLDVVFLAMFVVVPLLAISIYLTKRQRRHTWHKWLQIVMASVLLIAVLLFELDMRLNGWQLRAIGAPGDSSPYFDPAHKWTSPAGVSLAIHLTFAIPTLILWIVVVARALREFSQPPRPGPHSRAHARWGWTAAVGMTMTALTGWIFYWMAFVAR
jgi:uncharacterized membrane protein YozB (DUF420 family)